MTGRDTRRSVGCVGELGADVGLVLKGRVDIDLRHAWNAESEAEMMTAVKVELVGFLGHACRGSPPHPGEDVVVELPVERDRRAGAAARVRGSWRRDKPEQSRQR